MGDEVDLEILLGNMGTHNPLGSEMGLQLAPVGKHVWLNPGFRKRALLLEQGLL